MEGDMIDSIADAVANHAVPALGNAINNYVLPGLGDVSTIATLVWLGCKFLPHVVTAYVAGKVIADKFGYKVSVKEIGSFGVSTIKEGISKMKNQIETLETRLITGSNDLKLTAKNKEKKDSQIAEAEKIGNDNVDVVGASIQKSVVDDESQSPFEFAQNNLANMASSVLEEALSREVPVNDIRKILK